MTTDRMKITAGLGEIDAYPRLVRAGADEVFLGYVPLRWLEKYGNLHPLNRREVLYYNIQADSAEDMRILASMIDEYGVPAAVTFNALGYLPEQYPIVGELICELLHLGFSRFIVADVALLEWLRRNGVRCALHLSGECAEYSVASMEFYRQFAISRFIFHRKNTIDDMSACIRANGPAEYEAFMLNERCHYTGAFCNSLHCDELPHLCLLPYRLSGPQGNSPEEKSDGREGRTGSTGCGLCALPALRQAGITHLKVVGRGNHIDCMESDVRQLRRGLDLLDAESDPARFQQAILREIMQGNCSHNCYYR